MRTAPRKSLVAVFDVEGWDEAEVGALALEVQAQAESSGIRDGHGDAEVEIFELETPPHEVREALVPAEECAFCVLGRMSSSHVMSNRAVYVVKSQEPKAETHLLVIPRAHVGQLTDLIPHLVQAMHEMTARVVERYELGDGWRLVVNSGKNGKQKVPHVHFHVLAGPEVLQEGFTRDVA